MSLDKLIETQIQEAIAAGAFENLAGAGKPLPPPSDAEKIAGDNWMGFHVLQNAGLVPEWLGLGREIEVDLEQLGRIESRYRALCESAGLEASPGLEAAIGRELRRFEELAREIRRKQERFNLGAPGPRSQRPPIWVEHHVERLRAMRPTAPATD